MAKKSDGSKKDTKPTNPKDTMASNRAPLHLLPPYAVFEWSYAMAEGAFKYSPGNYIETGAKLSVYVGAAMRHAFKMMLGEWRDPDTKVLHAASVMACMAIIIECSHRGSLDESDMAVMFDASRTDALDSQSIRIIEHLRELYAKEPVRG